MMSIKKEVHNFHSVLVLKFLNIKIISIKSIIKMKLYRIWGHKILKGEDKWINYWAHF
jgi:hypothetical protein